MGESYNRAYDVIVTIQQLRELEEIIEFIQTPSSGIPYGNLSSELHAVHGTTTGALRGTSYLNLERKDSLATSTDPETNTAKRDTMQKLWYARLREVRRDTETWQQILSIHSLVSSPKLSPHMWLKFSNLMRKQKNFERASKLLESLLSEDPGYELEDDEGVEDDDEVTFIKSEEDSDGKEKENSSSKPLRNSSKQKIIPIPRKGDGKVYFSYLNLLWDEGGERKMAAFRQMSKWISRFKYYNKSVPSTAGNFVIENRQLEKKDSGINGSRRESDGNGDDNMGEPTSQPSNNDNQGLSRSQQARCYAKLAQWYLELHEQDLDESNVPTMIETSKQAIEHDPEWHKAWRTWAVTNYTALQYYHKKSENHPKISSHHLPAVSGFIRSIALSPRANLQDTLRLLSLWFSYGYHKEIDAVIRDGFKTLNIDTWLSVLPQLIARIHVYHVRAGISQLLSKLGEKHPQALVFPITVATKDPMRTRVTAAHAIMNELKQHSSKLLQEAAIVSRYALEERAKE